MPLLKELVANLRSDGFSFGENVLVFGVQHLMGQTLGLCWALNALGLPYERIALCGKPYSTNPAVLDCLGRLGVFTVPVHPYQLGLSQRIEQLTDLKKLSTSFISRSHRSDSTCLVIDDGGHALSQFNRLIGTSERVAGLEQTASGLWQVAANNVSFPIVDVGASAVKRICEPSLVIDAVLSRAVSFIGERVRGLKCGIVGLGYIGNALAERLTQLGANLCVYDTRPDALSKSPAAKVNTIQAVFSRSEIIFGCTGSDITAGLFGDAGATTLPRASRTLISLSSGDDEFFKLKTELLRRAGRMNDMYMLSAVPNIQGECWGSEFTIVRNGFPINFDNSIESAPIEHIQGTIAALIGAICQAHRYASRSEKTVGERIMLDVGFQRWLYSKWLPLLDPSSGLNASAPTAQTILDISTLRTNPHAIDKGDHFGRWAVRSDDRRLAE
jgi:hypothetical protein